MTPSLVYAGTDVGVFVSSTASPSWTEVGPAAGSGSGFLPSAPVTALHIFSSGAVKVLRVSTYGRGIWEFNLALGSATTTSVVSNHNPAAYGAAVTFTATVTTTGTNPPTGTVTFFNGATSLGTGNLNGAQVATLTTSALPVGADSITAAYGGDANNAGSTSAILTETINAPTFTVTEYRRHLDVCIVGTAGDRVCLYGGAGSTGCKLRSPGNVQLQLRSGGPDSDECKLCLHPGDYPSYLGIDPGDDDHYNCRTEPGWGSAAAQG